MQKYIRPVFSFIEVLKPMVMLGLLLFLAMTFSFCTKNKKKKRSEVVAEVKKNTVEEFKTHVQLLLDSTDLYLDRALEDIDRGQDPENVSSKWAPKINFFETQIDSSAKAFVHDAMNAGMTEKDYNAVFQDLNGYYKPITAKYKILKGKGFRKK